MDNTNGNCAEHFVGGIAQRGGWYHSRVVESRAKKKRDERDDKRERYRLKSEQLRIDMLMATCKLSYAVAMAVNRGKPNGEIEDGVEEYKKALDAFKQFDREKMAEMCVNDG